MKRLAYWFAFKTQNIEIIELSKSALDGLEIYNFF